MTMEHKELKVITMHRELKMRTMAKGAINLLTSQFPEARGIDIVNAFLWAFTERTDDDFGEEEE